MNDNILKKLHKTQLLILKEVSSFCDKNSIKYFLIGGTLIGAVRHNGFIPWDDDIDIGMIRSDYNKFLNLTKKNISEFLWVHSRHTDANYWLPYIKVKLRNSKFLEKSSIGISSDHGIFIDIFPFDYSEGSKSFFSIIQAKMVKFLSVLVLKKRGYKVKFSFFKNILYLFLSLFSFNTLLKFQEFIMTLKNKFPSKYLVSLGSNYDFIKQTIPENKYFPLRKLSFENELFSSPNDYHFILSKVYGSYYVIPPKSLRLNHTPLNIEFNEVFLHKYEHNKKI